MSEIETTPPQAELKPLQPADTPSGKSKSKPILISLVIVLGILLLLGIGIGSGILIQKTLAPAALPALSSGVDGNTTITREESTIASVVEKVNPSVVSIIGTTQTRSYFRTSTGQAAGTGILVSSNGYVLTNNHVVQDVRDISIIDSEGNQYKDVTLVGRDPLNDIAFLKIKSDTTFKPAQLGNSSTLRIGQQVVAIGNALGQYSNTVTSGIVSGTGRPITASSGSGTQTETLTDLIQTDASINPGNSGGPLVNMAGQIVGINTAIVEDANGIGFAIPINSTKGILAEVLETGKANRAFLGVNFLTVTPEVAERHKLPVKQGAYLYASSGSAVGEASPAEKAGLKTGDIITKINDATLGKAEGLSSIIGLYRPNDTVTITYLRDGRESTTQLTLSAYNG
jgi:serine protease Do